MTILVITPTLGRSPHLAEAVASVAALGADVRHVLVSPRSESQRLRRVYPALEVVDDEGAGVYAAINRGLQVGGAWDVFTWLNDDDRWRPEGMMRVRDLLERKPDVAIAYGRVGYIGVRKEFLGFLPIADRSDHMRDLMAAGIAAISQQGTLVRRTTQELIGPLDVGYRLAADFAWFAQAVKRGVAVEFVNTHAADFRIRAGQLSQDGERMKQEMQSIVTREFGRDRRLRIRCRAWMFRIGRVREIVTRYRLTGCWRTATLLQRYGREQA